MSKQTVANKNFVNILVSKFFETQRIKTVAEFCAWLVRCEVLPEMQINNWLALYLYGIELERTKTAAKPKGVKWVAEGRVLEQVPISRRKLQNLLKNQQGGARAYLLRK